MLQISRRGALVLGVLPLLSCAQAEREGDGPPSQRVVLFTTREWPSTTEVVNHAMRLSGVQVRDALETGPRRYRMTLLCADDAACRQAMARIAADRGFVQAVDVDGRQQIPAKPSRESSR